MMSKPGGASPRATPSKLSEADPVGGGVAREPYVPLPKVAAFLGVSAACIRKWRERGCLPFPAYKCGQQLMFKLSEADAWLASQRHFNAAEARELGR